MSRPDDRGGGGLGGSRFKELVGLLFEEHSKVETEADLLREEVQRLRTELAMMPRYRRPSTSTGSLVRAISNPSNSPEDKVPHRLSTSTSRPSLATDLDMEVVEEGSPINGASEDCGEGNSAGAACAEAAAVDARTTPTVFGGESMRTSPSSRFALKREWKLSHKLENAAWGRDLDRNLSTSLANDLVQASGSELCKSESMLVTRRNRGDCIIHPSSALRFAWDIVGLVLIAYDIITIPMMVFDMPATTFSTFMDWLTLSFWTGDMIQSFFLGYYEKGLLVRSRRKIVGRYFRTWFVIDLLVVVPDWVMSLLDTGGAGELVGLGRILRAARAVRMLRLLRLLKLQRLVNTMYDMIDSEYTFIVLDLSRLLIFIFVLNHVIACIWFLIGTVSANAGEINWLEHAGYSPVRASSFAWQYTTSLHWSLTQFTPASMDVSARNVMERVFSIVVLFFALVAFGTIVGSVTGSMTALRNMKGDSVKQFWMLRRFLKQKKIGAELKERIVKFLEHKEEQRYNQVQEGSVKILGGLSQPLRNEMTHEMYMPHLEMHPFLAYMGEAMPSVVFRLCTEAVKAESYALGDVIFYPGDEATRMYFVKNGKFDYELEDIGEFGTPVLVRAWIAEAVLWIYWRHRGQLRTRSPGDLLAVDPGVLAKVMSVHPRPWYFARNYGLVFVQILNDTKTYNLTDLFRFDSLHNDQAGYSEEVANCDDWRALTRTSECVSENDGVSETDMDEGNVMGI